RRVKREDKNGANVMMHPVACGSGVLSASYPDVLRRLPCRSPADSGVPPSAPPGSHSLPPLRLRRHRCHPQETIQSPLRRKGEGTERRTHMHYVMIGVSRISALVGTRSALAVGLGLSMACSVYAQDVTVSEKSLGW